MTATIPTSRIISVIRTSIGFLDIPVNEPDLQKAQEMAVAMAADMEFTAKESSIEPVDGWHTDMPDRKEFEIAAPDLAQRIANRLISESQPFEMARDADGVIRVSVTLRGAAQVREEIEDHTCRSSPEAIAQRKRLVDLANDTFGSDTLQIDPEASHAEGDDGTWIPAWVLVQPVDDEEEDGSLRPHTP
ncbi:hypothetical protein KBW71_00535 [Hydrogenophaga aromaticivorans]|uniref:hypothetical protein n=1 Tax=Hydrogenophaga aromaticivorans TaxID=2610898 RepID=UPI001B36A8ED|nr:hypothetical protein [Hydrogenophaga aromaticivorans]MBQ0916937.1 hypothetical protein [Hydrogenophaga aromaticivorans]MBU4337897.1 hypothetical protein [Actinomycetota bacterium]